MSILLTLAGIWLSGAVVLAIARKFLFLKDCFASAPETFAVGVAACHVMFLTLGLLGHDLPWWLPALIGAPLLVVRARVWFRCVARFSPGSFRDGLDRYAWVLLAMLLLLQLFPTLAMPLLDWDARILWGYKAKILAGEGISAAGAFLAGAVMTKNEGLLLTVAGMAALLLVAAVTGRFTNGLKSLGTITLCWLLLVIPWFIQRSQLPPVSDENYLARLTSDALVFGLGRLDEIGRALIEKIASWRLWHAFWLALPVWSVIALVRRPAKIQGLFVLAVLIFYSAGIFFVYLISPWRNISMQIDVTFDRVMLPMLIMGLLLGAYSVSLSFRGKHE